MKYYILLVLTCFFTAITIWFGYLAWQYGQKGFDEGIGGLVIYGAACLVSGLLSCCSGSWTYFLK